MPGRFKVCSEEWQGAASGGKEPVWPGVGRAFPRGHCSLPAVELGFASSGPQISICEWALNPLCISVGVRINGTA